MIAEICANPQKIYFRVLFKMYCKLFGRKIPCTWHAHAVTIQALQVSEQLLAIWKRDVYLRSCTYAQRRIHYLIPQQKELSEQVNSMKMIFTLNLKNSKREATSKVSLLIRTVFAGIATRGLFRKLCVKRHKVQELKMLWPNLREQGDQNSKKISFLQCCVFCGGKCDIVKDP